MGWATWGPIMAAALHDLLDDDLNLDENFCHYHENSESLRNAFTVTALS